MRYHILLGHLLFIINNLLVLTLSLYLARLAMGKRAARQQVLAAICNFALLVYAVELVTGITGFLNAAAVAVLLSIITLLLIPSMKKYLGMGTAFPNPGEQPASETDNCGPIFYIALALLAGSCFIWAFRSLFSGTCFRWDDLSYHAFMPAKWLVEGKITLAPYPYQAYYPYNAELLSLWFMLPYYNDAFAGITAVFWGGLSAAALFTIVYLSTHSMTASCLAPALFLASGSVQNSLTTFSSLDLAGTATALAALALAYGDDSSRMKDRYIDFFYCGLLSGFAAGIKISLIPIIPVLLMYLALRHGKTLPVKSLLSCCSLFMTGAVLTGGFWYMRNLIFVGNPLFPAEIGPFKGPLTAALQYNSTLISWILSAPFDVKQTIFIIKNLLDWPIGIGIVAAAGYILTFCSFWGHKTTRQIAAGQTSYRYLLFTTGVLFLILFPLTPFSGRHEEPGSFLMVHNRYVFFPFAIGLALFSSFAGAGTWKSQLVNVLSVLAFISAWAYDGKMAVIFLTAGVMAAILWVKLKYLFFSPRAWAAVLAAVVVLLPARYTTRKHLTDENVFAWSDISYMNNVKLLPAGRAWREIEDLPRGSRIGFLASAPIGNAQYYPLFGRSLQFIPLPLMSNGALQQPLHITWDWLGLQDQSRAVVPEEFLRNLEQENVQYLIMTRALFTDTWPPQRNILDNSNKARRIYSDGFSIIWKIETG